jgi:MFS family permease
MPNTNTSPPTMLSLLRSRPHYRRMIIGNTISQLGDWLSYVAISLLITRAGEGGVAIALVYVAHTLPSALAAPIAGALADRYDRRRLMISSYLLNALITTLMCLTAAHGWLWTLQLLLFTRSAISAIGFTARQAATPSVVEPRELYAANALSSLIWSVLFTAGVALGGLLSALLGPTEAIAIDALTFALSALAIWRLPPLPPSAHLSASAPTDAHAEREREGARGGIWSAWRLARRDPQLTAALLAKTPAAALSGAGWLAINALATARAPSYLDAAVALGLSHAVRGAGTGIGPIALRRLWPTSANAPTLLAVASLLALLWAPNFELSLAALLLWGMGSGYNFVRSTATIQLHAPHSALGRLTAFDFLCLTLTQSIMALLTGALMDSGAPLSVGVYVAALSALAGLSALTRLERRPRHLP